jgi:hypothetical protein
VGSERKQTLKVRKWKAQKGQEIRFFTSRAEALGYLGTRGVPTPYSIAIEDYELRCLTVPRNGEDEDDPENWTGARMFERVFALYGSESPAEPISRVEDRLRAQATARRFNSYRRAGWFLNERVLFEQRPSDMPSSALRYARQVRATFDQLVEDAYAEMDERKRLESLPTVRQLHERAVAEDLRVKRVSAGTADNAKYVAAPWLRLVGDKRVDLVEASDFELWLRGELGSGSKSRLSNAVTEIERVRKFCIRTPSPGQPDLKAYSTSFSTERLKADLSGVIMQGTRKERDVLSPAEVEALITACETVLERGSLALALLGVRSLGEPCGGALERLQ